VVKRTTAISMKEGRDQWLQQPLEALDNNVAEIMDAEDPLFILYTSGSTGKPKGMVHTTAGLWFYTAYTFKMYLTMKKMIFSYCRYWLDAGHPIFIWSVTEWATTVILKGFLLS
jgi:acetyl-CoA synthetase